MSNFYFILIIILIIFGSVAIHEFGHFIFAKIFKITVYEFSIGIGPKLFSFLINNTEYSLRIFPILAFVTISSNKTNHYYLESLNDIKEDRLFNDEITKFPSKYYFKKIFTEENFFNNIRTFFLSKNYIKYNRLVNISKNSINTEEISLWKNLIIIFGGILMNLILFIIGFLILKYGLKGDFNLGRNIQEFFINLGKILIFEKAINDTNIFQGNIILINFMILNLSLILLNILPIPPLDGFRIISILFEKIFKRSIPEKFDLIFGIIGIIFILYISIAGIINMVI